LNEPRRSLRRAIEEHYALWLLLSGSPSPSGFMLDNAKLGLIGRSGSFRNPTEDIQLRFADASIAIRDLTRDEYWALVLRFCGTGDLSPEQVREIRALNETGDPRGRAEAMRKSGHELYMRNVAEYELHPAAVPVGDLGGQCRAPTKGGGMCRLARLADSPRCHLHQHLAAAPATYLTRAGEEVVSRNDDRALVQGARRRDLDEDEVARLMGITRTSLRALYRSARRKAAEAGLTV